MDLGWFGLRRSTYLRIGTESVAGECAGSEAKSEDPRHTPVRGSICNVATASDTRLRAFHSGYALRRVLFALVIGLAAGGVSALFLPWQGATLLGWDLAATIYLVGVWSRVLPMNAAACSEHALREDPSHALADSVILVAAIAELASVGLILVKVANAHGGMKAFLLTIGVLSVVLAWGAVHTMFTLRYARIYYAGTAGGIDFNEKSPPDYVDFAYLAFTIGMTFQVSDTDLTSKAVRRTALRHALISFLFGAVIIGLVINVVASLLH